MAHRSSRAMSDIIRVQNGQLTANDLLRCLDHFKTGHVVAIPTDTVYGIGCNAFQPEAIEEIYRLKGRSYTKPLPLLLGDSSQLPLVARDIVPEARRLIDHFWPGPLTLVLKTAPLALAATRGKSTVGVRVPDNTVVRRLSNKLGVPLAVTSANRSGGAAARTFHEVRTEFFGEIPILVDGGPCPISIESTVVDATHFPFTVLRNGAITKQQILSAVSP